MKSAEEWISKYSVDTKYDSDGEPYMSIDSRCIKAIQLDTYKEGLIDATNVIRKLKPTKDLLYFIKTMDEIVSTIKSL